MFIKSLTVAAAIALTAVAAPAMAQSASTTGSGSITVIRPLTVTKGAVSLTLTCLHFRAA